MRSEKTGVVKRAGAPGTFRPKHKLEEKPCPTCLRVMKWVADHWECEKHGRPTRA